ncbi:alkaline-phosphatase-like protein [Lineolata rhizophorae]|uniref:Alkaline-phosphatase-like protein n=1 Tax=Lineolata rhizophorae TaxID=578093 RepID=A0A6A6NKV6_9PEZI|nr:alkaline-phosphatase-like protein [Lineolata rhizophorae]
MATQSRPNFLIILADDLGYSDIGCFGSEIRTPHLDELARNGARFTDYHTASACSPTRAMLLSGTDNHIAGVGVMSEQKGRDPERWNVRGHEGFLNHDVVALSEMLQDSGYHTLISGKWHLGLRAENNPAVRGFDRSFALLPGTSNHYGWEPQFGNDRNNFFVRIPPLVYTEDGKRFEVPANTNNDKNGFFSSDYYTDNLIRYLKERSPETQQKPFFAYLPFSAPHWPLQCAKEDRDRYRGVYDDGPDALRLKRLSRLQDLGLVSKDVKPHDVVVEPMNKEWSEMTNYERKCSARSMECFAGMVDNIDQNVGKVVEYLKQTGEFENTVIIFQSDNGAEGATYEAIPTMGADLMRVINTYYDNSFDNIGNATSFVWYGTRWAQASTAPSRLYKMYTTEGGIKVPFLIHYAKFAKEKQSGSILRPFCSVMDICPTVLDLAGVSHPAVNGKPGTFRNREVAPMRGKSWVPYMMSGTTSGSAMDAIHGESSMGWELFGRGAVRKGKYKLVHIEPAMGGRADDGWQLYDLSKDPGETEDLADTNQDVVKELLDIWEQYRAETGVVWGTPIKYVGEEWDGNDEEGIIGGDAISQTRAWMRVRKNEPLSSKM